MTTKVTVTNHGGHVGKQVRITPVNMSGVPHGSPDHIEAYRKRLEPGEAISMWVHDGASLIVEEVDPPATTVSPDPAGA